MTVVERIFAHARAMPDKTALISNGRTISYHSLARLISLARCFLERQEACLDRVAVLCIHDILDTWIIGLALRSLGVTTVNGRSVEDIDRLDLGLVSVISTAAEADVWPGLESATSKAGRPLIVVTEDVYAGRSTDVGDDAPLISPTPGGHILLTSGTTGDHKKVLVDALVEARVAASNAVLTGITDATVINVLGFGGWTAAGYFWPACAWSLGAGVVIHQGPQLWRALSGVGSARQYVVVATPHMVGNLLAAPADVPLRDDAMMLFVVGGVLSHDQWQSARRRLTNDIRCIYGATETCLMTFTRVEAAQDLQWHRVNPTCQLQIVNEQDQPLSHGQIGVVRMRPTRVDGYLNDPETTRAFFRDGYFYPGDLGVLSEDGRLSLQGRVTDVINVLGDKYGSLPIETALQERLDAEAVCVFSAPGETGEEVHVAIHLGRVISSAELKAALLAALPAGIADVQVHSVNGFPRNHMGKIERAVLMAQLLARPEAAAGEAGSLDG